MAKISIIVPCYNQAQFLDEALQSVLEQTYTNWECIIVNDGSLDNTEEIAQKWVNKDFRFRYLYKENGGLSSARNFGILQAEGEFILPLDADDRISEEYVQLAINCFFHDTSLKVVYCKAEKFGDEKGIWDLKQFTIQDLVKENMIFCSALYRKSDWEKVGGYDENMIYGLEDWEFWISQLKNGGNVKCLDVVGFYYRIKSDSMLKQINDKKYEYLLEYLSVKHADFLVNQFGSFWKLNNTIYDIRMDNYRKMKSKKFVINLFCKTFLGFTIFKKNL